jgi:hypothetical protein
MASRSISAAVKAAPHKEYIVKEWWESLGYQAHLAKPSKVKRGRIWITHSNDLWESIDVAAMLPDDNEQEDRWGLPFEAVERMGGHFFAFEYAQVCTPAGARQHKRKIEAQKWPLRQLNLSYRVTIWAYRGNEFRVSEWRGGREWTAWPEKIKL